MGLKKIAAATAITGSLSAAALGLGAAMARADDDWGPWGPDVPWVPDVVDWDPGVNWWAPGQEKKWFPWSGPPGHWIAGPHGPPVPGLPWVPGHWHGH